MADEQYDNGMDGSEERHYETRNERRNRFIRQGGRSASNPWDARAWLEHHPERDFDEDGNVIERPQEKSGRRPGDRGASSDRDQDRGRDDRRFERPSRDGGEEYRNARRGGGRSRAGQDDGGRDGYRTNNPERGGWRKTARDYDSRDDRTDHGCDWDRDDEPRRARNDRDGYGRRGDRDWDRDQEPRGSRDGRPSGQRDRREFRDDRRRVEEDRDERDWDRRPRDDEYDDDYYDDDYDDELQDSYEDDPYARRVVNPCPVAKRCGGCEWLSMPYEEQLGRKQEYIEDLFGDYKCGVDGIMGMNYPQRYRNKVQLPFAPGWPNAEGRIVPRWGIFERGSHHIVPCSDCIIEDERARPIIADVADLMPRYNIRPYDERALDGWLRYCLVRTAHVTGEVMLTLVATSKRIPAEKAFVAELLYRHPEITTIVVNVNKERTSVILGDEERVVEGPGYITDKLCGCKFRISSSSFYQTNPVAAEALYDIAVELADLKPSDRIGDAYCGTGTIGIVAAKKSGAHLIGIERNPDAVEDARENALINGIDDAEFIVGDAGSVFARMARAGESLDVVFMDPPRAGATQAFLANLCRLSPTRVVYISCEPKTQRHDITTLLRNGYQIKRICPVDMFPHTDHVENIVLLERKQVSQGRGTRKQSDHSWLNADQTTSAQRGQEHDEAELRAEEVERRTVTEQPTADAAAQDDPSWVERELEAEVAEITAE